MTGSVRWASADAWPIESWDALIDAMPSASPFQLSCWADTRRAHGWTPIRLVATAGRDEPIAAVQVLTYRVGPGPRVGWAPGGPVFAESALTQVALQGLPGAVRAAGLAAIRLDSPRPAEGDLAMAFATTLARPLVRVNTGFTAVLSLVPDLGSGLNQNHRRAVRRADRAGVRAAVEPLSEASTLLRSLHEQMIHAKGEQRRPESEQHLRTVARAFGPRAVVVVGRVDDEPVAAALALRAGRSAVLSVSGTSVGGRACSAGHRVWLTLAEALRERGALEWDLGGLGITTGAGVNRFKLGLGAVAVNQIGEWECGSGVGRAALNAASWMRRRNVRDGG